MTILQAEAKGLGAGAKQSSFTPWRGLCAQGCVQESPWQSRHYLTILRLLRHMLIRLKFIIPHVPRNDVRDGGIASNHAMLRNYCYVFTVFAMTLSYDAFASRSVGSSAGAK
jgi:hypothetical protein